MVRVVVLLALVASLAGAASPVLASRGHKPKLSSLPKVHVRVPHGRRGQSSYGGPSWSGSSYDHHKPRRGE